MTTETTVKMTVKGDTFKAKEKLKAEGFAWNAGDKSWSCDLSQEGEVFSDVEGNAKGTISQIRHMIKCYAKSDKFTVEVL